MKTRTFACATGLPTERRRDLRYRLDASARFSWQSAQDKCLKGEGIASDISPQGAFIQSFACPPVSALVQIEMLLPFIYGTNRKPFPATIWDYINRSMPFDQPSFLSADEVYAVVAFLFYSNGIIKEGDVLNATTLPKIQMPNRNGFFPAKPEWKPGYWQPYFTPQIVRR